MTEDYWYLNYRNWHKVMDHLKIKQGRLILRSHLFVSKYEGLNCWRDSLKFGAGDFYPTQIWPATAISIFLCRAIQRVVSHIPHAVIRIFTDVRFLEILLKHWGKLYFWDVLIYNEACFTLVESIRDQNVDILCFDYISRALLYASWWYDVITQEGV